MKKIKAERKFKAGPPKQSSISFLYENILRFGVIDAPNIPSFNSDSSIPQRRAVAMCPNS